MSAALTLAECHQIYKDTIEKVKAETDVRRLGNIVYGLCRVYHDKANWAELAQYEAEYRVF